MKARYVFALAISVLLAFSSCKKEDKGPSSNLEGTSWSLESVEVFGDEFQGFIGSWGNKDGEGFDKEKEKIEITFGRYNRDGGQYLAMQQVPKPDGTWEKRFKLLSNYATVGGFLLAFEFIDNARIPDYTIRLIGKYELNDGKLTIHYTKGLRDSKACLDAHEELTKRLLSNSGEEGHKRRQHLRKLKLDKENNLNKGSISEEERSKGFKMVFTRMNTSN